MYHLELRPRTFSPSLNWEKEVEKIFEGFNSTHTFAPACEIVDTEKYFLIGLDVPGLQKEDIEIEVKDDHLWITGERKENARDEKDKYLRRERKYGKFSRAFSVPQNVNLEAVEARFENGVLEVVLPKEEKAKPKKITISDWKKETSELKN